MIFFSSDEMAELEMRRRTGSATRPVRYVRHISQDTDNNVPPRRRASRSRDSNP